MSTIVENTNPVTVDIEPKYSVTTQSGAIVENKAPEYSVSVQRKEYKVVGDNIYIPRLYDDAPQWMKDLVNTVVDVKTAVAVGNLDDALEALRTLSDELDVAKNTYTNSIISSNDIDQRINTAIETLNSALSDADATIINIAQTATTPAEASAIALNTLSASLSASGEIGSFISNMNSAFADLDNTTTQSINFMESAINAEFSANATALNTIRTYVGIDSDGNGTGTGLAEAITQLGVDISNEAGLRAAGDTTVTNTVKAYADSVGAGVESKWEYNSVLGINGIYKKSGFGLTTNYTSGNGTESNPYVSEFWIDATKLRFTNSNATGRNTPFTIDATGITPEITFNGKVTFGSVNNATKSTVSNNKFSAYWFGDGSTQVEVGSEHAWTNYSGSGELIGVPNGLQVGNNSGNDQVWLVYNRSIPINKNKRYKVTVEAQQTAGIGTAYFGFAGRNYNDTLWINSYGVDTIGSQFYPIADWDIPATMTERQSLYWSVGGTVAGTDGGSIRTDVAYYRPLIIVNYSGQAGVTIIKKFEIEEFEPEIDVSGDINANNNTFAQKLGYADYAAMVAAATSGQTIINGGYIGTNLVKSSSILANSVSADRLMAGTNNSTVWTGGGLVSSDFNGNTYGNIGSPTSGFRLSSNAVGTSQDPNIYGAYIKGGTIEGVSINVYDMLVKADGYPLNTGRISYAGLNGSIYMPGYGTGFNERRVCSKTTSIVKLEGWHRGATSYLVANLYYRINGGNWINIASKTAQAYGYQEAFYIYFSELFNMSGCPVDSYVEFLLNGNGNYANSSPVLISIYNN